MARVKQPVDEFKAANAGTFEDPIVTAIYRYMLPLTVIAVVLSALFCWWMLSL